MVMNKYEIVYTPEVFDGRNEYFTIHKTILRNNFSFLNYVLEITY